MLMVFVGIPRQSSENEVNYEDLQDVLQNVRHVTSNFLEISETE